MSQQERNPEITASKSVEAQLSSLHQLLAARGTRQRERREEEEQRRAEQRRQAELRRAKRDTEWHQLKDSLGQVQQQQRESRTRVISERTSTVEDGREQVQQLAAALEQHHQVRMHELKSFFRDEAEQRAAEHRRLLQQIAAERRRDLARNGQ